jgi:predicted nuclease of predicted toxin-antitoxin system
VRLLLDMNLSPEWVPYLQERGFDAVHWSSIGAYNAPDSEIMQRARENDCVVFTHGLDFGILLAHSKDSSPSVIQARTQDVSPDQLGRVIVAALQAHRGALGRGALLTIDAARSRIRILPI